MNASLAGRTAFISGAGHGIGRATALEMARLGATVGVNDLKIEFVEEAVAQIRAAGGQAIPVPQDISTREGMREAVQRFARDAGRLDVMVNNAAWVRYQPLAEITPEVMDRMVVRPVRIAEDTLEQPDRVDLQHLRQIDHAGERDL